MCDVSHYRALCLIIANLFNQQKVEIDRYRRARGKEREKERLGILFLCEKRNISQIVKLDASLYIRSLCIRSHVNT